MTPGVTKVGLNKCYTVVRDPTKMKFLQKTTLLYQLVTLRQFQDSLLKFKIFNLVKSLTNNQTNPSLLYGRGDLR